MSGKFNMDDYVDVPERIRNFAAKYPEGSLQSELTRLPDGWLCKAYAYRSPDDLRPGVGHAFEPVPGKTPYTKDSEAMNAETSAWGRAVVALGFETKKIASQNEVRNRQSDMVKPMPPTPAPDPARMTVPAPSTKAVLSAAINGVELANQEQLETIKTLCGQLADARGRRPEDVERALCTELAVEKIENLNEEQAAKGLTILAGWKAKMGIGVLA